MKMRLESKKNKGKGGRSSRTTARLAAAALLSFGGVCALPWMFSPGGEALGYTNSIFTVFLFGAIFWLVNRALDAALTFRSSVGLPGGAKGKASRWLFPGIFGMLFSAAMVFGNSLDKKGFVPFQNVAMWAALVILWALFTLLARYFWDSMAEAGKGHGQEGHGTFQEEREEGKRRAGLFLRAGVIFLCYLPVFFAVYPGFFVYDAQDEYLQVVTRNFTTHHPLVHVLLLGGMLQLVYKLTGSYNLGIACYTLMQMTVMSLAFAWCVEKMKARGLGRGGRILLTLYFGLCPVLVMFSLCSAKDGLFTGAMLVTVIFFQELWGQRNNFFKKKGNVFWLAASAGGMMLFRHNGFYAYLLFSLVGIAGLWRGRRGAEVPWIKPAVCFALPVVLYLLADNALGGILHADRSERQELLTVPISQMARVYRDGEEGLPAEEKEILYKYLPREALLRYNPKVSDGVKIAFDNKAFGEDKAGFFRLWAKWGARHPFTYLNAWFMTSYGYWYPDTVIDVYRGNSVFTFTYEDSSYFGYEVEQPGARESKIPWLDELYRKMSLEIFQQKVPVISMLFSPGFLFWVTIFLLGFLCHQRSWGRAMPFLLPVLYWLTLLLGPTYLVRYTVFLWVLLPLLIWETLSQIRISFPVITVNDK